MSELQVGETYAVRGFNFTGTGELTSPMLTDFTWGPGENTAECSEDHEAPYSGCRCGFYAYTQIPQWSVLEQASVVGIVGCYGHAIHGDLGLRASKAQIVALWFRNSIPAAAREAVQRRYPSATIHASGEEMIEEYGIKVDPSRNVLLGAPTKGDRVAVLSAGVNRVLAGLVLVTMLMLGALTVLAPFNGRSGMTTAETAPMIWSAMQDVKERQQHLVEQVVPALFTGVIIVALSVCGAVVAGAAILWRTGRKEFVALRWPVMVSGATTAILLCGVGVAGRFLDAYRAGAMSQVDALNYGVAMMALIMVICWSWSKRAARSSSAGMVGISLGSAFGAAASPVVMGNARISAGAAGLSTTNMRLIHGRPGRGKSSAKESPPEG